jgi:hypothetical protein
MVIVVRTHQSVPATHHDAALAERGRGPAGDRYEQHVVALPGALLCLSRRSRGNDRGEKYLDLLSRALLRF